MAQHPGESIPKAFGSWTDAVAAYRLLSNGDVDADAIQTPHRALTGRLCAERAIVLAVSDITDLDFTGRAKVRGLGQLGDGRGRGLQQHTTLAVDPEAGVIGVLRQFWYRRPEAGDESRRARRERWCESDVWADAVRALGPPAPGRTLIHVGDRGADIFAHLHACLEVGAGFLIRAQHDRRVVETEPVETAVVRPRLWAHVAATPALGTMEVEVSAQRSGRAADRRVDRRATLTLRSACVRVPPPVNDPRFTGVAPLVVQVVQALEEHPPQGVTAVEWTLLSSEPAATCEDARRLTRWYAQRWIVEEFHRVEKERCRLECAQLDDALDMQRLAAVTAVVAVRLLQLRDAADPAHPDAQNPEALRRMVDPATLRVVAALAKAKPFELTPRMFWNAVARRGGWLARRGDGRPGWKSLWRGWHDIQLMALGADLFRHDDS